MGNNLFDRKHFIYSIIFIHSTFLRTSLTIETKVSEHIIIASASITNQILQILTSSLLSYSTTVRPAHEVTVWQCDSVTLSFSPQWDWQLYSRTGRQHCNDDSVLTSDSHVRLGLPWHHPGGWLMMSGHDCCMSLSLYMSGLVTGS